MLWTTTRRLNARRKETCLGGSETGKLPWEFLESRPLCAFFSASRLCFEGFKFPSFDAPVSACSHALLGVNRAHGLECDQAHSGGCSN